MFDIGWSEMAVILLVALVVIGPRDLPRVARTMGRWVAKGRAMAREFQTALEDMAREAELDKVKSEIEKAGRGIESVSRTNLGKTIEKSIDPTGELSKAFDPTAGGGKSGESAAKDSPGRASEPKALPDAKAPAASGAEAAATKPSAAKSSAAKPSATKPSAAKSSASNSSATNSSATKSSATKSSATKSSATKPSKPSRAKPAPAKPSTTKSSEHGDPPRASTPGRAKAVAPAEPREPAREPAAAEPS